MEKYRRHIVQSAVGLWAALFVHAAHADDWNWSVTPYIWAVSTKFESGVSIPPDGNSPSAESNFDDLLDNFDFGAQVHLEGHKNRYGFLLDLTILQLSGRSTQGPFEVDSDLDTTLIEGAVLIRLGNDSASRTELLLGFRYLDVDLELDIELTGQLQLPSRKVSGDVTLTDAMVGVRHTRPLAEKWDMFVRGDVASGDTDFTWNINAGVGRNFGSGGTLILSYRHMKVELDADGSFADPELVLSGPLIGYMFHF